MVKTGLVFKRLSILMGESVSHIKIRIERMMEPKSKNDSGFAAWKADTKHEVDGELPIADLFPECTVSFMDVSE